MKTQASQGPHAAVTVSEMQKLEADAFASGRVGSRAAMETAGAGVVRATRALVAPGEVAAARALILCGPGNNGGDGYVAARLLQDAGWDVRVRAWGAPGDAAPDAAANRALWLERGPVRDLRAGWPAEDDDLPAPDVVIDALFGIGLTRGITGALADRLAELDRRWPLAAVPRVAVDVPSGVDADADAGAVLGAALPATVSVTFHRPKPVHLSRPDLCGRVEVVDIGLDPAPGAEEGA